MVRTIQPGMVVRGYRIGGCLGEGSSGKVFLASDLHGREVVLKFVAFQNSWFKKEYEREVESLKKCTECPLIVNMINHFKYKGYGVIVLEKLHVDLLDFLQDNQPLSPILVKNIFFQVCLSISYIHKRSIAHLDIKPENIFMAGPKSIKLGDFGSSYHWQDDFELRLGAVGTSFYCAPEVGPSQPYNASKADVWSLGILLHVLLTGYWPYHGANEHELHNNVSHGNIHLFKHLLPDEPVLFDLLSGLLNHNPVERYSITDVLSSAWLNGMSGTLCRGHGPMVPHVRADSTPVIDLQRGTPSPPGLEREMHRNRRRRPKKQRVISSASDILPPSEEERSFSDNSTSPENDGGTDSLDVFEFSEEDTPPVPVSIPSSPAIAQQFAPSPPTSPSRREGEGKARRRKNRSFLFRRPMASLPVDQPMTPEQVSAPPTPSSLPQNLVEEPMKKPRTLVDHTDMEDQTGYATAAPIKRKKFNPRRRTSSFLNFINQKLPRRSSYSVDDRKSSH